MNDTALLRRLKALDLGADPVAARSEAAVDAEIARITALPTDRAPAAGCRSTVSVGAERRVRWPSVRSGSGPRTRLVSRRM